MHYKKLGNSSLEVSIIGFGSWGISGDFEKVEEEKMLKVVKDAYSLGINFFDTAPAYGFGTSEKLLGKALKNVREKIIIATKCGAVRDENGNMKLDLSKESIRKEIDNSLKRLQTDYIDLYQVHWPDPKTDIEETFTTLNELKEEGKVRFVGVCNYSTDLIEGAMQYCEIISSQNLYNLIQRNSPKFYSVNLIYRTEKEIIPFCKKNNLGFLPYAPFCQGLLTGKKVNISDFEFRSEDRRINNPELRGEKLGRNLNFVKELIKIAKSINKPLTQLVINWMLKNDVVTSVIAGPMNITEVEDNVESVSWEISEELLININNLVNDYLKD